MTYQEKLVMFMKEKTKFLHDTYAIKKSDYFIKKDEDAIMKWSDSMSKKVYNRLKNQVKYDVIDTLTCSTCVFCLKNCHKIEYNVDEPKIINYLLVKCDKCEYALNHKVKCDLSQKFWDVRYAVEQTHVSVKFDEMICQAIIDKIEGKKNV